MAGGEAPRGGGHNNPHRQIWEEILLSAEIIVGHGVLAILALAVGWVVHKALDLFTDPAHPFQIAGVTARYLIEGGELMLVGVVMLSGVISAVVLFAVRILSHMRG